MFEWCIYIVFLQRRASGLLEETVVGIIVVYINVAY